jgi:apolipoprotein N-acyltransferase
MCVPRQQQSSAPRTNVAQSTTHRNVLSSPPFLFSLAIFSLLVANGRYTITICAWLAPLFLLRFTREGKSFVRLFLAYLGLSFTYAFQFWGMVPFPGVKYFIFCFLIGLTLLLPYVLDRFLAPRRRGLSRTLVFPLALVCTEFLASMGPYGSWCSIAYTQAGHLVLLQLLAFTGLFGITFLIGWFASVGNSICEARFVLAQVQREIWAFGLILAAVLLFGGGRLTFFPPRSPTIRVATITGPDPDSLPDPGLFKDLSHRLFAGEQLNPAEIDVVRRRSSSVVEFLLKRTDREAQAGAEIVTFGEGEFPVLKQDEATFLQRCRDLAHARNIYIGLPMATLDVGHIPSVEDKLVLVAPSNTIAWVYYKTQLFPGFEVREFAKSTGFLPMTTTPIGRIGGAIAFDLDFPALMRQAGKQHTDLLIVPEDDSPEIDPLHSEMAVFRAIENGFNLVLHASDGLSLATDYQGRVYGRMDRYQSADHVMVAQVPTRGVATLYARIGYLFPVICFMALLGLALGSLRGLPSA